MHHLRFHCLCGLVAVLLFGGCQWLCTSEASPMHDYLLWHPGIRNFFLRVNWGPLILSMVLSGDVHQPSAVGFFAAAAVQWFTVGFLLSLVFSGSGARRHDNAG